MNCKIVALASLLSPLALFAELMLCENHRTEYVIVTPDTPTAEETAAITDMGELLKEATGADFRIVTPAEAGRYHKRIFVGYSAAMRDLAGKIGGLENEARVFRNIGDDILIYGGGRCGTTFAIYQFLDEQLGMRFYHPWGDKKVPKYFTLAMMDFNRKMMPSYIVRDWNRSSYTQVGCPTAQLFGRRARMHDNSFNPISIKGAGVHTFFLFVNPFGQATNRPVAIPSPYPIFKDTHYFETHPEFFSLLKNGKRSDRNHFCFANAELRRTLTQNVEKYLQSCKMEKDETAVINIEQQDVGDHFCWCDGCQELERKYKSPGGPLYDYLIETASPYFRERYPNLILRFLAYNREQTEFPPPPETLKNGKLPDNLCPFLAMLTADFSKPYNSKSNQSVWDSLQGWGKIAHQMWYYYYPTTYARPLVHMPLFGNVLRIPREYQLGHDLNVRYTYIDQESYFMRSNAGFVALNVFLQTRIANDVTRDIDALVSEYMSAIYGSAAENMKAYFYELERLGAADDGYLRWNPDPRFANYITPANLLKWQKNFDEMERLVAHEPRALLHVQCARLNLDQNTLHLWQECRLAIPDWPLNAKDLNRRYLATIEQVKANTFGPADQNGKPDKNRTLVRDMVEQCWRDNGIHFFNLAKGGKPLPEAFKRFPAATIRQLTCSLNKLTLPFDDEAAFGVAVITEAPANGKVGFTYVDRTKKYSNLSKTVTLVDGEPYTAHLIGRVKLSRDCSVMVPAPKTYTRAYGGQAGGYAEAFAGHLYDAANPGQEWDVYVSGRIKEGKVYTDRVVLVKAEAAAGTNAATP